MKPDIKSLTREEIATQVPFFVAEPYRLDQLLHWLYRKGVTSWESMVNLPRSLREQLKSEFTLASLEPVQVQGSSDATQKFLWKLPENSLIESVLIPANPALDGERSDRRTLCVSTQVGCAYGCAFCASGLDGWKRNLLPFEIVEQVMAVERFLNAAPQMEPKTESHKGDRHINNLVIMGMGEPLANYNNLLKALTILNAPWGGGIGARKITISTSGLVPQIRKLAEEPHQFRLAISLHGATDEVRNKIMPVNRKYPLKDLISACQYYQEKKGRMITLEYILIAGINDGQEQLAPLAKLARNLDAKVNLIPYNTVEGLPWSRPDQSVQEHFLDKLLSMKVSVTLRREKGHEIDAACGQLRLKTERALQQAPVKEAAKL